MLCDVKNSVVDTVVLAMLDIVRQVATPKAEDKHDAASDDEPNDESKPDVEAAEEAVVETMEHAEPKPELKHASTWQRPVALRILHGPPNATTLDMEAAM